MLVMLSASNSETTLGESAPGGVDQQTARELLEATGGQELVQLALGDGAPFAVKLALDRAIAVLACDLGHHVHANIGGTQPLCLGPIANQPGILILLFHARIVLQERKGQPLEIVSLFPLGLRVIAKLVKKLAQRRGHANPQKKAIGKGPRACGDSGFPRRRRYDSHFGWIASY
jgi:hypothetical protein